MKTGRIVETDLSPPPVQAEGLRIALLVGSDSTSTIAWDRRRDVAVDGNNDCWRLIDLETSAFKRFHIAPNYFRKTRRWDFSRHQVVLNSITDPDQNPKTIEIAERITSSVADHVVNRPRYMPETTRDEIAKRMQGIPQLVVPKVILLRNPTLARVRARAEEQAFRFPAILRRSGTHSGQMLGVFDRPQDLDAVFGDHKHEYYLTEFVDFVSPDGLYRKMRLFFIGDEVLFRHLMISGTWNIHARDRAGLMAEREDLRCQEQQLFEGGFTAVRRRFDDCLREIKRRIKLDYFGLDCAPTADGRLVLFELNATMNFFPLSPDPRFAYLRACVKPAKAAMSRLLRSRARSAASSPH